MPGSGKLILTGQLGDVMKESAQAALSLVKTYAEKLCIDPGIFAQSDLHVHVPAGATPKDGPSAGVAMFVSLSSLLTGRAVPPTLAMTGEISLRGLVLPVGGIREKIVAADRAGIGTVMLPARNRRDYDDIPASTRERLQFVWLETVDDAMAAAFLAPPLPFRQSRRQTEIRYLLKVLIRAPGVEAARLLQMLNVLKARCRVLLVAMQIAGSPRRRDPLPSTTHRC